MKLSEDFTLYEMTKSSTSLRLNIDNTPNDKEIANLKFLSETISQPCRDNFGRININSGFRCKLLNDAIGSSDKSFHRLGCAEDIEADNEDISNLELLVWIYKNLEFTELIAEYFNTDDKKAGWVHVAAQKGNAKKVLKLKDKNHNYSIVSIDYIIELYS